MTHASSLSKTEHLKAKKCSLYSIPPQPLTPTLMELTWTQLSPCLMHSSTLQCRKTSLFLPENWKVLKQKWLEVPCPLPVTFTVSSMGLGQLWRQTEMTESGKETQRQIRSLQTLSRFSPVLHQVVSQVSCR